MNRRIEVLLIDHTPFIGGAQLWQATVAKQLDRANFSVSVVTGGIEEFSTIYKSSNIKRFQIHFPKLKTVNPLSLLNFPTAIKQLQKVINQVKPDLIITNTTRGLIAVSLTRGNFKLIPYLLDYKYPKWLLFMILHRVKKYLCVSRSIQDFYHLPKNKAAVVYLGSNLSFQKNSNPNLRQSARVKRGDLVVGFVGRLVKDKGVETVIQAINNISDSKAKLLIFGTGDNQQGSVEESIKAQIQKFHLEDRVKLMGFVSDRAAIFQSIDVFVMPTLTPEPFASTLLEAAQSRVPIVATRTGGTSEFIHHNQNGLLFDPGNSAQLARFLVRLNKTKSLRNKLSKQALKDAEMFRSEKVVKRIEEVLIESCTST